MTASIINTHDKIKYYNNNTLTCDNYLFKFQELYDNKLPVGYIEIFHLNLPLYFGDADDCGFSMLIFTKLYSFTDIKHITKKYRKCKDYKHYDYDNFERVESINGELKYYHIPTDNLYYVKYKQLGYHYLFNKIILIENNKTLFFPIKKVDDNTWNIQFTDELNINVNINILKYNLLYDDTEDDYILKYDYPLDDYITLKYMYNNDYVKYFIFESLLAEYSEENYSLINIETNKGLTINYIPYHLIDNYSTQELISNIPIVIKDDVDNLLKYIEIDNNKDYHGYLIKIEQNNNYIIYCANLYTDNYILTLSESICCFSNGDIFKGIIKLYNLEILVFVEGVYEKSDGTVYSGKFIHNMLTTDNGEIKYPDGTVYKGAVSNNLPFYGYY